MNPDQMNIKDHYPDSFNDKSEWFELYGDVKEHIPKNLPRALGKGAEVTAWVDADYSGDKLTRHSHTGLLIFVNSAPIFWYSKLQATIESSTFGSEVVSLRTCLELIKYLQYELRMTGLTILRPDHVWGDNKGVVNSASIPETRITKKHLGIFYHAFREVSEQGIWKVGFCKVVNNIADCLTNILSGSAKDKQVSKWMYRK